MEAVTYKCPGCGSNIEFDPASSLFVCRNCGQYYKLEIPEINNDSSVFENAETGEKSIFDSQPETQEEKSIFDSQPETQEVKSIFDTPLNNQQEAEEEFMDIRVYHCSSCGSEIMTNDVNVSTFCSYCGQSTIIFDRISKEKRPTKIIPFAISKDEALRRAKERFSQGKYTFNSMEDVTVDSVYGIYMPYWVYNADIYLESKIDVRSEKGRLNTYNKTYETNEDVMLDASKRFNDAVSIELNPYHMTGVKKFDSAYLSGFYADRSDVQERDDDAKDYMIDFAKEAILDRTPGVPPRSMRNAYDGGLFDYRRNVDFNITKSVFNYNDRAYMFLPVFFITFMVEGKPNVILVNGQTGKIVGNVPVNQKKLKEARIKSGLIGGIIFAIIGAVLFRYMPIWWAGGLFAIISYSTYKYGANAKAKFDYYYARLNSDSMFSLSNDRRN